jgi:hypothetical protein
MPPLPISRGEPGDTIPTFMFSAPKSMPSTLPRAGLASSSTEVTASKEIIADIEFLSVILLRIYVLTRQYNMFQMFLPRGEFSIKLADRPSST